MAYPPVPHPIADAQTQLRVTTVWRKFFENLVSAAAAGITQLTGDVTAGPGGGSQVATISPLAVTTGKIANDAVTYAKMQNVSAASRLLGRGSAAGAGDVEEITLGTNLTMSGTTLNASGGSAGWARTFAVMGS